MQKQSELIIENQINILLLHPTVNKTPAFQCLTETIGGVAPVGDEQRERKDKEHHNNYS